MKLFEHHEPDDSNSIEHGEFFESLIKLNHCKEIVEIGVAWGSTTRYLCRGAQSTGGWVDGYDIWDYYGENLKWGPFTTKEQVEELLTIGGFHNFDLHKINSLSNDFKKLFNERHETIDFAFIDGDHSYDGIKSDFDIVYPKLTQSGIIALHDTSKIDGCREFVIDLRTKYYDGTYDIVEFPFGNQERRVGLTLLVKRSYPVQIDEICGSISSPDEIYKKEQNWLKSEIENNSPKKKT